MVFNSIDFLVFFPIVCLVYFIIPKKIRYIWLLIASYYFYMSWNPKYAVLIAASTVITYASGILISKADSKAKKNLCVAASFIINLGILGIFKYGNFFLYNVYTAANAMGIHMRETRLDLLLPVGISFYTFQALSYTMDVYRERIKPEKNILTYALFVSFFPQLVAGPIERSENLLTQIQKVDKIELYNAKRIKDGLMVMLWGFFQKLIIADRVSIVVKEVYKNYENYGAVELILASVLFAFQIYCDFGGYSNIARGAAQVMGFKLMHNFKQPYLATSIKDFWRRWHISLTTWFTDYLYIPLGGNRKGTVRKYINILIVFAVSGLWHGASYNFVVWGLVHAIFQVVGDIKNRKLGIKAPTTVPMKVLKVIGTFILTDFAWVFFASDRFMHAIHIFGQMGKCFKAGSLLDLGLDVANWWILIIAIIILITVDILHEKKISLIRFFNNSNIVFRYAMSLALLWAVVLFGVYGYGYDASTFIYFQF